MNTNHRNSLGHKLGTAAIETRLTDIALLMKTVFPDYVWHCEPEGEHPETCRLDIQGPAATTSVVFTNRELLTYSIAQHRSLLDRRMYYALRKAFDTPDSPPPRPGAQPARSHNT